MKASVRVVTTVGRSEAHSAQIFSERLRPLIGRSFINRFLDQSQRRIDDLSEVSVLAECTWDLPSSSNSSGSSAIVYIAYLYLACYEYDSKHYGRVTSL